MKKKDLAKRLNLRYATLLDWEKNRHEVYERLILSYEYEKALEDIMKSISKTQEIVNEYTKHIKG